MKAFTARVNKEMRSQGNDGGFTLLETAIALVVMMVLGLAASALFVYAIRYNSGANDRALSLALAQQRMERLRKTSFADAALNAGTVTETYDSGGRSYNVVTIICATSDCGGSPTSKLITIQVAPVNSASDWARNPATIISSRSAPALGQYFHY